MWQRCSIYVLIAKVVLGKKKRLCITGLRLYKHYYTSRPCNPKIGEDILDLSGLVFQYDIVQGTSKKDLGFLILTLFVRNWNVTVSQALSPNISVDLTSAFVAEWDKTPTHDY